jgi:GNAT superfamily N-acetyltransferase
MIELKRTDSRDPDFIALVKHLDVYLAEMDGDAHSFYAQFNTVDAIKHVVVAYDDGRPVGCGAIKEYAPDMTEVKRMYTAPECRGKGVASRILTELETWASEMGYDKCILETGRRQTEAIGLYHKNGYMIIPNYGQYDGIEDSVCFEKSVRREHFGSA